MGDRHYFNRHYLNRHYFNHQCFISLSGMTPELKQQSHSGG
jgi:hypothetical protein